MSSTIKKIELLSKELQSLLPMKAEDQQRLDKKFRLEFNFNSNHIEGNTLTYGETVLLLIFDDTKGNHTFREYEEMKSHDVAFEKIKEWASEKEWPLTETQIKNLNEIILVRPFWKDAQTQDGQNTRREINIGNYKKYPNSVRLQNGEMFEYASPTDTPILMGELINWYREEEEKKELHPVQLAALLHYKFVHIHPFDDGNGRISRLLMNYVLLKNNLPPIIIKSEDKKNYLHALHLADVGDMNAFVDYVAAQLAWSLQISIKAAKGESVDEEGDLDKKLTLLKKQLGNGAQEEVKVKYGTEAVKLVVEDVLIPLALKWEKELQKFDSLFLNRKIVFDFGSKIKIEQPSFNDIFPDEVLTAINNSFWKQGHLKQILINISFNGLRNIENSLSLNGGSMTVSFFKNAYEIEWGEPNKVINRLYHQILNESEINEITSFLGNLLFNRIEEFIEKKP